MRNEICMIWNKVFISLFHKKYTFKIFYCLFQYKVYSNVMKNLNSDKYTNLKQNYRFRN